MKFKISYNLVLGILQLIIGIGAVPSGVLFLIDTSGKLMGTSVTALVNAPFNNFLFPGLFLLVYHGLGNLVSAILSFRQDKLAGLLAIGLGGILMIWIVLQVRWIGYNSFLQPMFLGFGVIELILGFIVLGIRKPSK